MSALRIFLASFLVILSLSAAAKTYRATGEISFSFMAEGREVKLISKSAQILYNSESGILKVYLKTPSLSDGSNRAAQYYLGDNLYFEMNVRQLLPAQEERRMEMEYSNSSERASDFINTVLRQENGALTLALKGKLNLSRVFQTAGVPGRTDLRRVDVELLPTPLSNLY